MGRNSFEQLCINFVNEKVYQFCTRRLIKDELDWYNIEGISIPNVEFLHNEDILREFNCKNNM